MFKKKKQPKPSDAEHGRAPSKVPVKYLRVFPRGGGAEAARRIVVSPSTTCEQFAEFLARCSELCYGQPRGPFLFASPSILCVF